MKIKSSQPTRYLVKSTESLAYFSISPQKDLSRLEETNEIQVSNAEQNITNSELALQNRSLEKGELYVDTHHDINLNFLSSKVLEQSLEFYLGVVQKLTQGNSLTNLSNKECKILTTAYSTLSAISYKYHNYTEAIHYLKRALYTCYVYQEKNNKVLLNLDNQGLDNKEEDTYYPLDKSVYGCLLMQRLAHCYYKACCYGKSIRAYNYSLEQMPEDYNNRTLAEIHIYKRIGDAYIKQGQVKEAQAAYGKSQDLRRNKFEQDNLLLITASYNKPDSLNKFYSEILKKDTGKSFFDIKQQRDDAKLCCHIF